MPPEKRFSKEQIVGVAFEIAGEDGIEGVTARKVAEKMGSSVAPIYANFKDIEELKKAVVQRSFEIGRQMLQRRYTGNQLLDIGVASLRFAKEYSVLFRDLMLTPNDYMDEYEQELGSPIVGEMMNHPELEGFTEEEVERMFLKLRIFQLGLSVMVANRLLPAKFDEQAQIDLLESAGEDVIATARLRKQGDLE